MGPRRCEQFGCPEEGTERLWAVKVRSGQDSVFLCSVHAAMAERLGYGRTPETAGHRPAQLEIDERPRTGDTRPRRKWAR
jgi:hypothetical protein